MDSKVIPNIKLVNNKGKQWASFENCFVKGYVHYKSELLYGQILITRAITAYHSGNLAQFLRDLNGNFSLILHINNKSILIVDKLRTYPLIFGLKENSWFITDNAFPVLSESQGCTTIDETSIAEFLALGYVSGHQTVYNGYYTVDCGEYVELTEDGVSSRMCYYQYIHEKVFRSTEEIIDSAYLALEAGAKRVFSTVPKDSRIVIPLSGGYDSRLIACLCKKYAQTDVLCYTYGRPNSFEVQISKRVAEKLGFKWYYVEYTPELFEKTIISNEFKDFATFTSNLNSIPHVQDFMAIKELRTKKIICDRDIVIPGFCGDIFGGSKVPREIFEWPKEYFSPTHVSELIYYHFYDLNTLKNGLREKVLQRIKEEICNHKIDEEDSALNHYEQWCIRNRISKYIINSLRVYEFFGLDWRMPLWDDEYSKFWYTVPWRVKSPQLLSEFMFKCYFNEYDVAIKKAYEKRSEKRHIRILKELLPKSWRLLLRKVYFRIISLMGKNDENCFNETARRLSKSIQGNRFNYMIKSWKNENIMAVVARLEANNYDDISKHSQNE